MLLPALKYGVSASQIFMNEKAEKRLNQILDELPYYWDTDNPDSNVRNMFAVIASLMGDWEEEMEEIRTSRPIETAYGDSLDYVAGDVGVTRDVVSFISNKTDIDVEPENDEMLRRRVKWNVALQESSSLVKEIKDLMARGLVMYRVRTGLGGLVNKNIMEPENLTDDKAPKWNIKEGKEVGDTRYVEGSDIYIFNNREPSLAMSAPDSYHGKFGNLTNYYQVNIPWQAMPWREGETSLVWTSQDNFNAPFLKSFSKEDLSGDVLSVEHDSNHNYPIGSLYDKNGEYVVPDDITVDEGLVNFDLPSSDYEELSLRLFDSGFKTSFTDTDTENGWFHVHHALSTEYPPIIVFDENDNRIIPDDIHYINKNNLEIYFENQYETSTVNGGDSVSSYDNTIDGGDSTTSGVEVINGGDSTVHMQDYIDGNWTVFVAGGESVLNYVEEFTSNQVSVRDIVIQHDLTSSNNYVVLVDENNDIYYDAKITEEDYNSTRIRFPSKNTVTGTWKVGIFASRPEVPEDDEHGWDESVWSGEEEELRLEPVKRLSELTRPVATQVGIYGYGGTIWRSQSRFDDPENPPKDQEHGWGSKLDGDVEETIWAMENLDHFWLNY